MVNYEVCPIFYSVHPIWFLFALVMAIEPAKAADEWKSSMRRDKKQDVGGDGEGRGAHPATST